MQLFVHKTLVDGQAMWIICGLLMFLSAVWILTAPIHYSVSIGEQII